jgi:hypothetical protein
VDDALTLNMDRSRTNRKAIHVDDDEMDEWLFFCGMVVLAALDSSFRFVSFLFSLVVRSS